MNVAFSAPDYDTEPPALEFPMLPRTLNLYDFGYDETEVDLAEPSGITLTQVTEDGETQVVILSRGMLEELWPYYNTWLKLKP